MSKNVYINGVVLYRHQIEEADGDATRGALIDTLESIHLQRAGCYDDKGVAFGNLVYDLHRFRPEDHRKGWMYGQQAVELLDQDLPRHLVLPIYRFAYLSWKDGQVEDQDLRHLHARLSAVVRIGISREHNPDDRAHWVKTGERLQDGMPLAIMKAGDLTTYFDQRSPEILTDSLELSRMAQRFKALGATSSPLYSEVLSARIQLNPELSLIAEWLELNGASNPDTFSVQALKYRDDLPVADQARLNLLVAAEYQKGNRSGLAYEWAQQAREADPSWGMPSIFQADLILSYSRKLSEKERLVVSAIVLGHYEQALSDPANSALARTRIVEYQQHLPLPSQIFHFAVEGDQYQFQTGWMKGMSTVVRTRKP
jgi:hypothetical protein